MYKLDLPIDLAEQAAVERRRRLEKERQSRIFNNKHRLIGVDKQALDQQIADKKFMEEMERKRSEAFGINHFISGSQHITVLFLTLAIQPHKKI
jgi:hypothetical protein